MSLCAHACPRRVLIIGGGDGGVLREVLRHETVEHVDLVDIDGMVIEQSKRFFPAISCGFSDSRVQAIVGDGVAFVKGKEDLYDVIIVDSSDPEGPASELFGEEFYQNVKKALKPGGIVCSQGESIWLHLPLIESMVKFLRNEPISFSQVQYAMVYIPTYPCGSIGAILARKDGGGEGEQDLSVPTRPVEQTTLANSLKYYDSEVHRAAFVLPRFAAHLNK